MHFRYRHAKNNLFRKNHAVYTVPSVPDFVQIFKEQTKSSRFYDEKKSKPFDESVINSRR